MSRVKLLLDVINDIRSLADSLDALANTPVSADTAEKKTAAKSKSAKNNEENMVSLEDVRKVLAEKSRAGFTNEVKAIITAHGSDKLLDINPSEYPAVLKEAEVIGNA